jgi:hypothetical protein
VSPPSPLNTDRVRLYSSVHLHPAHTSVSQSITTLIMFLSTHYSRQLVQSITISSALGTTCVLVDWTQLGPLRATRNKSESTHTNEGCLNRERKVVAKTARLKEVELLQYCSWASEFVSAADGIATLTSSIGWPSATALSRMLLLNPQTLSP